ncbi:VPLPA-CTERM sorting domain-containing protein [Paracoccus caeni]|uniref:VPLPA-CTERM sorting domain-containing protein n=1 Tax=Paracoccus caeni TaxID=657651 RepID=A0A934SB51_9RHOB|nr:DUF1194 domain-containing protein [Paracoccus caeni]MBK4215556.1 VPLPA-CTERM sorting domain-containing protein [Paracoccus caeni]
MRNFFMSAVAACVMAAAPFTAANAATIDVDVELQLLVDVSGSVDSSEFALQRDGYVDAFRSSTIQNAILSTADGRLGKIAVEFIYWSGQAQQQVSVGWALLDSVPAINAFADAIEAAARPFSGQTAVGSAINFGYQRFATNDYNGTTNVIDVSGDGADNQGTNAASARDAALAAGIDRINGLPIGGSSSVESFYANNVIGGSGSFLLAASDFNDFSSAVAKKLEYEITGENPNVIPLPAAGWLLIAGLGGLGLMRRRTTV